jgi:hypothetical protein
MRANHLPSTTKGAYALARSPTQFSAGPTSQLRAQAIVGDLSTTARQRRDEILRPAAFLTAVDQRKIQACSKMAPELMEQYLETAKERRQEERLKNVDLNEWLPITSSRNAKWYYSAFHNVTAMVGAGVLGLPCAMSQHGWGLGTPVIVGSFVITLYTLWQMVEMHEMVPGRRFDRYHELGQHASGWASGSSSRSSSSSRSAPTSSTWSPAGSR